MSNTTKRPTQILRKTAATKDYSYDAIIEAKRNNPFKSASVIIEELGLPIKKTMVNRIIRNAKTDGLL